MAIPPEALLDFALSGGPKWPFRPKRLLEKALSGGSGGAIWQNLENHGCSELQFSLRKLHLKHGLSGLFVGSPPILGVKSSTVTQF